MQPNPGWSNMLKNLPEADEPREAVDTQSAADRRAAVGVRESRRAYDGAPPVVPRPITQRSAGACMTCHCDTGGQPVIAGKVPPRMRHAFHASCTQCHAPSANRDQRLIDLLGVRKPVKFPVELNPPSPPPPAAPPAPPEP